MKKAQSLHFKMKINISKYRKKDDDRRIDIQIEKFDTWSLDHTLALIIFPALVQLKGSIHGVPSDFANVGGESYENQLSFDFYSETTDEMFNAHSVTRWEEVLDKMIWSFQQIAFADWEEQYYHGESIKWLSVEDGTMLNPVTNKPEPTYSLVDTNPEDHWTDFEGIKAHRKKIQEGLELFGKYYSNLWD